MNWQSTSTCVFMGMFSVIVIVILGTVMTLLLLTVDRHKAALSQLSNELSLVQDREKKQRKALGKKSEECARFARHIAKVRHEFAKKKRQWENRGNLDVKQLHERRVSRSYRNDTDPPAMTSVCVDAINTPCVFVCML